MPLGSGSQFNGREDFQRAWMYTTSSWNFHIKGLPVDIYEYEKNSAKDTVSSTVID